MNPPEEKIVCSWDECIEHESTVQELDKKISAQNHVTAFLTYLALLGTAAAVACIHCVENNERQRGLVVETTAAIGSLITAGILYQGHKVTIDDCKKKKDIEAFLSEQFNAEPNRDAHWDAARETARLEALWERDFKCFI